MKKFNLLIFLISLSLTFCSKKEEEKIVIRYSAPGFVLYNQIRENLGKEFEKKI